MNKLKNKLSQNSDNLTEYDNVMKDQLKNGINEKVEGPGNPRKVMYLPHQAVISIDQSSTKLCLVFDVSAKKVGPKGPKSFYVDDFNSSVQNVTENEGLYKKRKLRFLDALMFVSGKQTVLNYKITLIKWKRAFHQVQKFKQ